MEKLFAQHEEGMLATGIGNEQGVPEVLGDAVEAIIARKEPLPDDPFGPVESRSKLKRIFGNRGIQIAPVGLLFGFAAGIYIPVFTELVKDRVCEVVLGYPDTLCAVIGKTNNTGAADEVRSVSAEYMLYTTLVSSLPCILFALFLGPWSDRFGRKVLMMMPFLGSILSSGILIVCAYKKLHPGYLIAVPTVAGVFGGWTIFLMSSFSYIGDYTVEKNRALVIALFSGFLGLGISVGQLGGTVLLKQFGFTIPFYVYAGLQAAALVYVLVVVKDHPDFTKRQLEGSGRHKVLQVCEVQGLKDNWTMICRKRVNNGRRHIVVLLIGYTAAIMCLETESTIMQLFLEFKPLSWDVQEYGTYASASGILNGVVLTITIPLFKKVFHLHDTTIGIFASVSGVTMIYLLAVSTKTWMIYAALGFGVLRQLIYVCLQSSLIGLVDREETGKVMSVVGIIQGVSLILSATAFVKVFGVTAKWWPGFVLALEAFVMVTPLVSFCYVDVGRR